MTSSVDPVSGILVLLVNAVNDSENMITKLLFVDDLLLNEVIFTASEIPSKLLDCEGDLLLSNDMIIGNKKHKTHKLLYRDTSYKLEAVNFKDKFLSIYNDNKLTLIDNSEHIAVARVNYHDYFMINNDRVIPFTLNTISNGYRIEWQIVNNGVISIIIDSCAICIDITHHNLDGNNKKLFYTDEEWVSKWKILTCGSRIDFVQFASMELINKMIDFWNKKYKLTIKQIDMTLNYYSLDNIHELPKVINKIVEKAEELLATTTNDGLLRAPWFFSGIMLPLCNDVIIAKESDKHYIVNY